MNGIAHNVASLDIAVFLAAAAISCTLLLLLRPWLHRYALTHPNARSSHIVPTPQGGGIGVIAATVATVTGATVWLGNAGDTPLGLVLVATVLIAVVGAIDDVSPIPVLPRLLLQAIAVVIILTALPNELRVVSALPYWLERTLLGLAILWFVNLVNFMDGIDWMTAAEAVPITAAVAFIGIVFASPPSEIIVALALCGAVVGFAPLNRPVAKLFLGDVGSLAIGLLLAWLLVGLAGRGFIAAALLLPLYYLADATITLFRRLVRGEPVWQAHRTHFYQRAVARGSAVMTVVVQVFATNVALAVLAVVSACWNGLVVQFIALACGGALVYWLLLSLSGGERP